jgi:tetratricopeptide (TPR) repeat protein
MLRNAVLTLAAGCREGGKQMPQPDCIGEQQMLAFLLGDLAEAEARAVAMHLESCATCEAHAQQLDSRSDGLLRSLRRFLGRIAANQGDTVNNVAARQGPSAAALPASVAGYEVLGEIGQGGMGVVYHARDCSLDRPVALKLLQQRYAHDTSASRRFLYEAQITGQLQHPGIPPVHQLGTLPDGRPFLAMKLIQGRTLDALLREQGAGAARWLAVFDAICQAVAYAHSKGVIHRDLKPGNVMVGAFAEVQVMDWGLAKVLASQGHPSPQPDETDPDTTSPPVSCQAPWTPAEQTRAGTVLGTPAFMPPEQAIGAVDRLDRRSDVFGLGAILCAMLTGKPPFVANDAESTRQLAARAKLDDAFTRLDGCGAEPELIALAKRCLAVEQDDRPADAGVLAAAVGQLRRQAEERARQAEMDRARVEVQVAEQRKRRRLRLGLATAVVLLVLGGGGTAWRRQQQRQQAGAAASVAMNEARLRLEDGRFTEAEAAAEKAEELARTAGAAQAVQEQAQDLAELIRAEAAAARRDKRLLAALLEVRGPREGPKFRTDDRGFMAALAEPSADEQFAAAFQEWDATFDVDALSTEEAAARLRSRPAAVRAEVIAALDEWASERRRQRMPQARWRQVADLATALDDSPNSRQGDLRRLLARGTLEQERALGMLALALRPVPVPFDAGLGSARQRLRWLMDRTNVAREPVLGLLSLARALQAAGDDLLAERLLAAAVQARPHEVVLQHSLGEVRARQGRWREAVECYTAARALRPELGVALAEALVKAGRVSEGMTLFERLVAARPNNPWLRFVHGNALHDQGRFEKAEAAYREALRLKHDYPEAHTNLGVALFGQGRHKEAEAAYRAAIRLKHDLPQAHNNLGAVLHGQGRYREAEVAFSTALRLKHDYPEAHYNLGNALNDQGRHKEAEAASRAAIRLQDDYPEAYNNLGIALNDQGRFEKAEAAYREAIRLKHDYSKAHTNLGIALNDQGRHKEAEAACREAIRLNPDLPQAHYSLGFVLNGQSRHKEAEAAYRAALRLKPDYPEAHYNLGIALSRQDRHKEAEAAYRAALRLKHDYPEAHTNLGIALNDQGRHKEAEAACREAICLNPDYSKAHNNLGIALNDQGRHKEAEAACREAIRIQHDYPEAHVNLGNTLNDQGRHKEAEAACREAIRLNPDLPQAHYSLGGALSRQDRHKEAEAAYRAAIRLKHDFPQAHVNLGVALDGQGRPKEAEAAYRQAIRLKHDFPEAHCNLGHALREQGRFSEALPSLNRGHALGSARPGWPYPSASWARHCQRLVELDRLLTAVLKGDAEPGSALQRLELASLCQMPCKRLHATATRFAIDAFTADPKRAGDLQNQDRYNAACSAALAAAGQADDARFLPDRVVLKLRRQAYRWLRADLALYARLAEQTDPRVREGVRQRLAPWRTDTDFVSVRDQAALAQLDADERQQWQRLWQEVDALLQKVTPRK